ncbi:PTS sugar transporter subunit IIB [Clostridium polynesiense]|uniref:PTS sugar transporter subunit IIB n=1 Tax=Clostridium polynesiense TaxID=1325933 RepID=UPI000590EB6B|nr:PTS sugar transporter subunit IIB [Clostridium polynesiense]
MKQIVLTRIDDRLIHGQVMTSWLKYTGANKIMVIDDVVSKDQFMKAVLKSCVPANVMLSVFSASEAVERIKSGFNENDKIIILVKYPKTLYDMMQQGIDFEKINIGGMAINAGRKKFHKNIAASEEEKAMLKEMINKGTKVSIQIIANDSEIDVSKLL